MLVLHTWLTDSGSHLLTLFYERRLSFVKCLCRYVLRIKVSVCVYLCVCVRVCLCWGLKSGSQANQTSWKFCLTDGIFVKGGDKPAGGWQHLLLSPVTWVWFLRLTCRENQLEQLLLWSLHVCHGTCMPTHIHIYEISVKKNSGQSILHSTSNVWGFWFHHITTKLCCFLF